MSAHTPGPWLTDEMMPGDQYRYVYAAKGPIVCRVNTFAAGEANARLIAAAPELLAALKDVVRSCRKDFRHEADPEGEFRKAYAEELALIAKAEGKA